MTRLLLTLWLLAQLPRIPPNPGPPRSFSHQQTIEEFVIVNAVARGLPPDLALSTIEQESAWVNLHSPTDDHGLMQLHRAYFPDVLCWSQAMNVDAGELLLAKYWQLTHDRRAAYAAFHFGPQALRRYTIRHEPPKQRIPGYHRGDSH